MSSEGELIVLTQRPVIEFSELEAKGLEVAERISQLNLDTIDATEANRSIMKKMRSGLNKELEAFEDRRKMVHMSITKPYKDFTESYEVNIKSRYTEASASLKEKIAVVENDMLLKKTGDINAYFNSVKGDLDFLTIDDVNLKIILSVTDKKLKEAVDVFIDMVASDMKAISEMDNSIRIESHYKQSLDLSASVTTVLADIKREEEAKIERDKKAKIEAELVEERAKRKAENEERDAKLRLERKQREAEQLEQRKIAAEKATKDNDALEAKQEAERVKKEHERAEKSLAEAEAESERLATEKAAKEKADEEAAKLHTMQFKVTGNISQLKQIKQFIETLGVTYE